MAVRRANHYTKQAAKQRVEFYNNRRKAQVDTVKWIGAVKKIYVYVVYI